jgi:hypothetical protein
MRAVGTFLHYLDSVTWIKPGFLDVRIAQIIPYHLGSAGTAPDVEDFFLGSPAPLYLEGWDLSHQGGYWIKKWIFKTAAEIPRNPGDTSPERMHAEQWSMSGTVMQVPIENHPNLSAIVAAGGGVFSDGRLEFPRYLGARKNPWYGVSDYLFPSIVLSFEKISQAGGLDFDSLMFLGSTNYPPSPDKQFSFLSQSALTGRKPWLLTDAGAILRGRKIVERWTWRWGGAAGWADPLYDQNWRAGGGSGEGAPNGTDGAR